MIQTVVGYTESRVRNRKVSAPSPSLIIYAVCKKAKRNKTTATQRSTTRIADSVSMHLLRTYFAFCFAYFCPSLFVARLFVYIWTRNIFQTREHIILFHRILLSFACI